MFKFSSQRIPCQVLKKGEDKESTETVEASKVKEEKLEVSGGKCWRGFWRSALCVNGEIFNHFPIKVTSVTISCSKDKVMFETFKSISLKESAKEHILKQK